MAARAGLRAPRPPSVNRDVSLGVDVARWSSREVDLAAVRPMAASMASSKRLDAGRLLDVAEARRQRVAGDALVEERAEHDDARRRGPAPPELLGGIEPVAVARARGRARRRRASSASTGGLDARRPSRGCRRRRSRRRRGRTARTAANRASSSTRSTRVAVIGAAFYPATPCRGTSSHAIDQRSSRGGPGMFGFATAIEATPWTVGPQGVGDGDGVVELGAQPAGVDARAGRGRRRRRTRRSRGSARRRTARASGRCGP